MLLTYEQAASYLGFKSARTVRRIVQDNQLLVVYPRKRSPRIPQEELQRYKEGLIKRCPSTEERTLAHGGQTTSMQAGRELDALLKPQTERKQHTSR